MQLLNSVERILTTLLGFLSSFTKFVNCIHYTYQRRKKYFLNTILSTYHRPSIFEQKPFHPMSHPLIKTVNSRLICRFCLCPPLMPLFRVSNPSCNFKLVTRKTNNLAAFFQQSSAMRDGCPNEPYRKREKNFPLTSDRVVQFFPHPLAPASRISWLTDDPTRCTSNHP